MNRIGNTTPMPHDALWRDLHRGDVWELLALPTRWHRFSEAKTSRKFSMRESETAVELLAGSRRTIFAHENFDGPHVWHNGKTLPQDAQKVRPARPQRVKIGGVPSGVR